MRDVRIQGHRGWRGKHPENSWIGIKEVLSLPISAVEIDVVEGPNKELVVSHDPWFADKDGRVRALRDFTSQEFSRLRFGTEPHSDFPEQKLNSCRIMFFQDLLSRWPSTGPTLNIEIKSKAIWEDRFQSSFNELGDALMEVLESSHAKLLLQSFDWRLVQQLGMLSSYPVNWICESLREWEDFQTGYRFT
ncbi:MAG: glycerophosphodiester phosphodiesterase, partial [Flavobacteriales bacterium]